MDGYEVIDPQHYPQFEEMVAALVEGQGAKWLKKKRVKFWLKMSTTLVWCCILGIGWRYGVRSYSLNCLNSSPSPQIIKLVKRCTSGAFLMVRGTNVTLFGDCAITINPDAEALAEIAINSAIAAKMFGIEPKIMLITLLKGSGFGDSVDKVVEATKIAHDLRPDLEIDGELQFDAAFHPETAALKAPGSNVAGQATVFIFPVSKQGILAIRLQNVSGFGGCRVLYCEVWTNLLTTFLVDVMQMMFYKLTLSAAQAVHQ